MLNNLEVGKSGIKWSYGYLHEEFLTALQGSQGIKVYREMSDNDSIIGACLHAIKQILREARWTVKPGDENDAACKKDAAFLESCMSKMIHSWSDFISNTLSMLPYGWSYFEQVFELQQNGSVIWKKLAHRKQSSMERWEIDDVGEVLGLWQRPAPDYKLVYLPMTKALLFRTESAGNNPEGRSILRNAYRCYSDDTEILTEDGWKLFSELSEDVKVATLNPKTEEIIYQCPVSYHKYDHQGKMFHQGGRYIDLLVTPNHKMWVRSSTRRKQDFSFVEADKLPRFVAYKKDGVWKGKEQDSFTLPAIRGNTYAAPERSIPMDAWLRFLGIFLSEGSTHYTRPGVVVLTQKADGMRHVEDVVFEAGFIYVKHRRHHGDIVDLEILDRQLYQYLTCFGGSHERYIPKELKFLSLRQLYILWNALMFGDGSYSGCGTPIYTTTSRRLADDVSEIIFKINLVANTRMGSRDYSWGNKPMYLVSSSVGRDGGNHVNQTHDQREMLDYNGKVYCVEVPEYHILYVRRNGKACWSGNSWYFKKNIEEIEGIGIERDLAGLPVLTPPENFKLDGDDIETKHALAWAKKLVASIRRDEQDGVLKPFGWGFELLGSPGQRQFDTTTVINRYNKEIAVTVLAQFIMLGMERTGSYALAKEQTDMFYLCLEGWADAIGSTFNRQAVPTLFGLNGVSEEMRPLPYIVHTNIHRYGLKDLAAYVSSLAKQECLIVDDDLKRYLKQYARLQEYSEKRK